MMSPRTRDLAQRVLDIRLQRPRSGRDLLCEAETLQLGSSTSHQHSKFGIAIRDAWSEISRTVSRPEPLACPVWLWAGRAYSPNDTVTPPRASPRISALDRQLTMRSGSAP
jgi:hypothetical protein